MATNILASLLNKAPATVATPAPSAATTATNGTHADADDNVLGITIPVVRAGKAISENGINRDQTNRIKVHLDEIEKLPGHTTLRETQKALSTYKAEKKEVHPQAKEAIEAATAEAKKDKESQAYKDIKAKIKAISATKAHISTNARITGAALADEVVNQCVKFAITNSNGKRLTLSDLLSSDDLHKSAVFVLFRDGKHCKGTIAKFEKERRDKQLNELMLIANAAVKNAPRNVNSSDQAKPADEPAGEAPAEVDADNEDDNVTPKAFLTYTNNIIKELVAADRVQKVASGTAIGDKAMPVESDLKKFMSEVAFDTLDNIGRAIVASFKFAKNKTLSGDNVQELVSVLLGSAGCDEAESDAILKKIETVLQLNDTDKAAKKADKDSKLTAEQKAVLEKESADKKALAAQKKEIREAAKALANTEIAKIVPAK